MGFCCILSRPAAELAELPRQSLFLLRVLMEKSVGASSARSDEQQLGKSKKDGGCACCEDKTITLPSDKAKVAAPKCEDSCCDDISMSTEEGCEDSCCAETATLLSTSSAPLSVANQGRKEAASDDAAAKSCEDSCCASDSCDKKAAASAAKCEDSCCDEDELASSSASEKPECEGSCCDDDDKEKETMSKDDKKAAADKCEDSCCDGEEVDSSSTSKGSCEDSCCDDAKVKKDEKKNDITQSGAKMPPVKCEDSCCDDEEVASSSRVGASCEDSCCDAPKVKKDETKKETNKNDAKKKAVKCEDSCCDDEEVASSSSAEASCEDSCCDEPKVMKDGKKKETKNDAKKAAVKCENSCCDDEEVASCEDSCCDEAMVVKDGKKKEIKNAAKKAATCEDSCCDDSKGDHCDDSCCDDEEKEEEKADDCACCKPAEAAEGSSKKNKKASKISKAKEDASCEDSCCDADDKKSAPSVCIEPCCVDPATPPALPDSGLVVTASKQALALFQARLDKLRVCHEECCNEIVQALQTALTLRQGKAKSLPKKTADKSDTQTAMFVITGMDCAGCSKELETHAALLDGIQSCSVSFATSSARVEFDSKKLSPEAVVDYLNVLKFQVSLKEIGVNLVFEVNGIGSDKSTATDLETLLEQDGGVLEAEALPSLKEPNIRLRVAYDPSMTGSRDLRDRLVKAQPTSTVIVTEHRTANDGTNQLRDLRLKFFVSLAISILVFFSAFVSPAIPRVEAVLMTPTFRSLPAKYLVEFILTTPIQFWVGLSMYQSAWVTAVKVHKANMDTLVMLSTTLAYFYSVGIMVAIIAVNNIRADSVFSEVFFSASALVICLVIFGRFLEVYVKRRATRGLTAMRELQNVVHTVTLVTGSDESKMDRFLVQRGDTLKVLPGEMIPTDGVVVTGFSSVDESMLSGESRPVEKQVRAEVFAGTQNLNGLLLIKATKVPGENLLDEIANEVEVTQLNKARMEGLVDRIANIFVIVVVVLAVAVVAMWLALAYTHTVPLHNTSPISFALKFGMALLIVACPCALGLAVPTAILVGTAVATKHSILIKDGNAIEKVTKINVVCFDKTGTLTVGTPTVASVKLFKTTEVKTRESLLFFAASAERGSEHPLGAAIISHAETILAKTDKKPVLPKKFKLIPGGGLSCEVEGKKVLLGTLEMLKKKKIKVDSKVKEYATSVQEQGQTAVFVAVASKLAGILALEDQIRPEATFVVRKLKEKGLTVCMVSGDHKNTCLVVAKKLGISEENVFGGVKPLGKAELVKTFQAKNQRVLMIGDGVNDAVALGQADVGVSAGSASKISESAADIALLSSNLTSLLVVRHLCHKIHARVKYNLVWAFVYNAILIPIAAGILYYPGNIVIPPAFAGLSELLSTFPVFGFSMLLYRYRPPSFAEDV